MGRGRESSNQVLGPYFKCGGEDHWTRDCPRDRPEMHWPHVERLCPGCHIEHLTILFLLG